MVRPSYLQSSTWEAKNKRSGLVPKYPADIEQVVELRSRRRLYKSAAGRILRAVGSAAPTSCGVRGASCFDQRQSVRPAGDKCQIAFFVCLANGFLEF